MASFTTPLSSTQQITSVIPHATGIDAPVVSTDVIIEDSFPSNADPTPISFNRILVLGNKLKKCVPGVKNEGIGDQYFNDIYVLPTFIDVGVVLSEIVIAMEVYSSYLSGTVTWTGYDDTGAGVGVSLDNASPPPPDALLGPQSGSTHELTVDVNGPPTIDSDLIFDFTDPDLNAVQILIPISGTRSVMFPYEPETPIVESLKWVTEINKSSNGFEQRSSLRDVPRSTIKMTYRTENADIRTIENTLFDGQARTFGIPVWFQATGLTSAIVANDTIINVSDTTNLNLIVGNLAIVWADSETFEALQISSFTTTTITFSSGFNDAFDIDSIVMPVLTADILNFVGNDRFRVGPEDFDISFVINDNGESLADTSAFNSYTPTDGVERVLLDDGNFVSGQRIREELNRQIRVIDNETSFPLVFTDQDVSRERTQKGFFTRTPGELSNVRALLHALGGRQVSFYLPSFSKDFDPDANVSSADEAVTVIDVDYVNKVAQRQPRNVIRVVGTDGTVSDPKLVTGSSKPGAGQETISIAPDNIGVTIALENIERIEYIKKSRIDTDTIEINHLDSNGKAAITFPVITVLEGDV